jgi:hypothetical protein
MFKPKHAKRGLALLLAWLLLVGMFPAGAARAEPPPAYSLSLTASEDPASIGRRFALSLAVAGGA